MNTQKHRWTPCIGHIGAIADQSMKPSHLKLHPTTHVICSLEFGTVPHCLWRMRSQTGTDHRLLHMTTDYEHRSFEIIIKNKSCMRFSCSANKFQVERVQHDNLQQTHTKWDITPCFLSSLSHGLFPPQRTGTALPLSVSRKSPYQQADNWAQTGGHQVVGLQRGTVWTETNCPDQLLEQLKLMSPFVKLFSSQDQDWDQCATHTSQDSLVLLSD